MEDEDNKIGAGYPLAQLSRALTPERIQTWMRVIDGMVSGSLTIGSRTPVRGTPAWVTLEVAHGGFATGEFSAGGPLLEHELQKMPRLRAPDATRDALNAYFLGPNGVVELHDLVVSGKYRVDVPEEAALAVVSWLLSIGEVDRASAIVEEIKPFLSTLRFYPRPAETAVEVTTPGVCIEPADETAQRLRDKSPQRHVEAMREAITVWAPLYERAVDLVFETVEGDPPRLVKDANGRMVADGGWPLRNIAPNWRDRVRKLLRDHVEARSNHRLCKKPDDPKENYSRLRETLERVTRDEKVFASEGDRKALRHLLASYVTAHGRPGNSYRQQELLNQLDQVRHPGHYLVARVVADRIDNQGATDEGCEELLELLGPVTKAESTPHLPANTTVPEQVKKTALRCLQTTPERLVELGLIPSADVLARILPKWTARSALSAISDQALRRLYILTYEAFRRRRSLLLLNLQRQVQLHELPWVSAITPWVKHDSVTQRASFDVLRGITLLTLRTFPHRITPNPLVKELKALVETSGVKLPLNEEIAADIFQGKFSLSFTAAALVAARRLRDTLYARYYGIDYAKVLAAGDGLGLKAFCDGLMKSRRHRAGVALNGQVIELAQVVTTHNLAPLVVGLELEPEISTEALALAKRCFTWVTQQEARPVADYHAGLLRQKNCAYAYRQMLFFLSLARPEVTGDFLNWAQAQPGANIERLNAVDRAHQGAVIGESDRFLGWAPKTATG